LAGKPENYAAETKFGIAPGYVRENDRLANLKELNPAGMLRLDDEKPLLYIDYARVRCEARA
jgi:hypothetical protein